MVADLLEDLNNYELRRLEDDFDYIYDEFNHGILLKKCRPIL